MNPYHIDAEGWCCQCRVRPSELKVYAVGELCWPCLYKVDPRK